MSDKNEIIRSAAAQVAENYRKSDILMYGDALRLPSRTAVIEIIRDFQKILFPAYYGDRDLLKLPPEQYSALLMGQIWRVITFVFVPFSGGGPLSVILGIYFTWFIGTALEKEWGDFRYTLYFLLGMVGTVLACLLTGVTASTYCLSLSLLLAFAMLYPEVQLLLFFVIPIRVKYFGFFAAALWVFSFLSAPLAGKLSYLLSMLNVWAFFGPMAYRSVRAWIRREQWKRKNRR